MFVQQQQKTIRKKMFIINLQCNFYNQISIFTFVMFSSHFPLDLVVGVWLIPITEIILEWKTEQRIVFYFYKNNPQLICIIVSLCNHFNKSSIFIVAINYARLVKMYKT